MSADVTGLEHLSPLGEAALRIAVAYGWYVFPCKPRTKEPLTEHGHHDATNDVDRIAEWWRRWPSANISVALEPSSLALLDRDPRNGGDATLMQLLRECGPLPAGPATTTGGGGGHAFFLAPPGVQLHGLPGLDVKTKGYAVLPPSIHPNGKPYAWRQEPNGTLPELPAAWVAKLTAPSRAGQAAPIDAVIPEGQRNATLASLAGSMRRRGADVETILAALQTMNATRCTPSLDDGEVREIAGSVSRYEPEPFETAVSNAAVDTGPRVYTIAEARLRVQESLEHLPVLGVDGYVVRGWSHLLAGWWRLGKSEFAAAVILPWLRSGLRVLWITEEPDSLWVHRADSFDEVYEPIPWERLTLVDAMSAPAPELLDRVVSIEADVVIADTVREVCGINSMRDDDEVRAKVSPWVRRLRDGQRTLLFLTQHRKSAGEHGERVEGSVALPSMLDVVLELEYVAGQENRRRLNVRRRGAQTSPLVYEMDDLGRMVVIPDARSRTRQEAEAAALFVVNESTAPLTSIQVRREMRPASRDTVRRALTTLAEKGLILRDPPITEAAGRRTVTWSPAPAAHLDLAQNFTPHRVEFAAPESVAPDSGVSGAFPRPSS